MANVIYQTYANAALNATGIASAVAWAAGGYVLTNPGAADNLGHLITFLNKTANDHSAKTLTIVGTDANDHALTETKAGPAGAATVTFVKTTASATTAVAAAAVARWTASAPTSSTA